MELPWDSWNTLRAAIAEASQNSDVGFLHGHTNGCWKLAVKHFKTCHGCDSKLQLEAFVENVISGVWQREKYEPWVAGMKWGILFEEWCPRETGKQIEELVARFWKLKEPSWQPADKTGGNVGGSAASGSASSFPQPQHGCTPPYNPTGSSAASSSAFSSTEEEATDSSNVKGGPSAWKGPCDSTSTSAASASPPSSGNIKAYISRLTVNEKLKLLRFLLHPDRNTEKLRVALAPAFIIVDAALKELSPGVPQAFDPDPAESD